MSKNVHKSAGELVLIELVQKELLFFAPKPIQVNVGAAKNVIPDLMFHDEKVVVFYDGCYWHECPEHHPYARRGAAISKDRRATARLTDLGWHVVRIWEHEDIAEAARVVIQTVKGRRVELEPERRVHVAAHDPRAWCENCENWPHQPWPIGLRGCCLRCGIDAGEHEAHPEYP